MPVFVTGATGFVGAHIVRALVEGGCGVRCLVRPQSRLDNLKGLAVEHCEGDLRDAASLRAGILGCSEVYHCAADYRLYAADPRELYESNVEGTRNLMRAAQDLGVEKVVHTSSVGALGLRDDGRPADETTPVSLERMIGHYKRSKYQAEEVALEFARHGLPVVIVNPSTPVGELDIKPTPTGQVIVDFLNRRMPAYVDTGLNLVDVRDVAQGHLLAAKKGRVGEKYILGNRNMSLKEICDSLAALTGLPSPRLRLPHWVPMVAAGVDTLVSRLRHRAPRLSLESVRMSRKKMYFESKKAIQELGLPQTPVERALERAATWFRQNGYVAD